MAKAKLEKVVVKLPLIEGTWGADDTDQRAAWEMYVELVTRVSVQPLGRDEGLLREALSSLYALFGETRRMINVWLRPVLSTWHPRLLDHEEHRADGVSAHEHERAWKSAGELRDALAELRVRLTQYADLLAGVCGIGALHRKA